MLNELDVTSEYCKMLVLMVEFMNSLLRNSNTLGPIVAEGYVISSTRLGDAKFMNLLLLIMID
jgi:hypothetical protein